MNASYNIEFHGKTVLVKVSEAAQQRLANIQEPIFAEMELYFSCLIRKKVRFNSENAKHNAVAVRDKLSVSFRPVMTKTCDKEYEGDAPPLTEFPIANAAPYVPRWLNIDYKAGKWCGEFGYD